MAPVTAFLIIGRLAWKAVYTMTFFGYRLNQHIQFASFIGPNIHHAAKDFWVTVAWRYQMHGLCYGAGAGDCNPVNGKVSDDHGRNEFVVKVSVPF